MKVTTRHLCRLQNLVRVRQRPAASISSDEAKPPTNQSPRYAHTTNHAGHRAYAGIFHDNTMKI